MSAAPFELFDGYDPTTCTFNDTSVFAFFGERASLPCQGNGICNDEGLCECFEGWRGLNDLYDLDGLACHNYILAEQVVWITAAVLSLYIMILLIQAAVVQWRELRSRLRRRALNSPLSRKEVVFEMLKYLPFRTTFPPILIAYPAMIILAVLRSFFGNSFGAVGTAWLPTILLTISGSICFASAQENTLAHFKQAVGGLVMHDKVSVKTIRFYSNLVRAADVWYLIGKIPTFILVALPGQALHPFAWKATVLSNCSLIVFLTSYYVASRRANKKISGVIEAMYNKAPMVHVETGNRHLTGRDTSAADEFQVEPLQTTLPDRRQMRQTAVLDALQLMRKMNNSNRRATFGGSLVYIAFCLPWFWPFQTYTIPLMYIIAVPPMMKSATLFGATMTLRRKRGDTLQSTPDTELTSTKQSNLFTAFTNRSNRVLSLRNRASTMKSGRSSPRPQSGPQEEKFVSEIEAFHHHVRSLTDDFDPSQYADFPLEKTGEE